MATKTVLIHQNDYPGQLAELDERKYRISKSFDFDTPWSWYYLQTTVQKNDVKKSAICGKRYEVAKVPDFKR